MTTEMSFRSLDDLLSELSSVGTAQRDATLQLLREIENGQIAWMDPHAEPWAPDKVARWITLTLESLANWKPGARPALTLTGTADYRRHLRFCRIAPKSAARAGAGRKDQHDWDEAGQYALALLDERGDPTLPENATKNWRSKSDIARAVHKYLTKRSSVIKEPPPELNTVRNRVTGWLEAYQAQK